MASLRGKGKNSMPDDLFRLATLALLCSVLRQPPLH